MANISLRIKVNENASGELGFTTTTAVNNVSSATTSSTTKNDGVNGISFATGSISLANGYLGNGGQIQSEKDKYNGFMFGAVDSNGNYSLTLTLTGTNVEKIVIYFDKNANQFATEALIDNERTIYSDDPVWAIDLGEAQTTHTIKFTKWNRPNYNACFTTIQVMLKYLDINNNWIENLESLTQTTVNNETIGYGIVPNTGNANILDIDGEIKDYINDGLIDPSYIPVELFINGVKKQHHITTNTDYDEEGYNISVSFSDESSFLSGGRVSVEEPNKLIDISAHDLFFKTLYPKFNPSLGNTSITGDLPYNSSNSMILPTYLLDIQLKNLKLSVNKQSSEVINDFCNITQLAFYKDNLNKSTMTPMRPIKPYDDVLYLDSPPVTIPEPFILSKDSSQIITKNKIKQVNIPVINTEPTRKSYAKFNSSLFAKDNVGYLSDTSFYESTLYDDWSDFVDKEKGFDTYVSTSNSNNFWYIIEKEVEFEDYKKFDAYTYDASGNPQNYFVVAYQDSTLITLCGDNVMNFATDSLFNAFLEKYTPKVYAGFVGESIRSGFRNKFKIKIAFSVKGSGIGGPDVDNNPFRFWILANSKSSFGYDSVTPTSETITYTDPLSDVSTIKNEEIFNMPQSDFLTSSSTIHCVPYGTIPLSQYLAESIILDYRNGLRTKTITIAYTDIEYEEDGVEKIVKIDDLTLGTFIKLSDAYSNGVKIIWEITGIKYLYDGEPRVQLELRETIEQDTLLKYPQFSLEDVSWEFISNVAKTGMADKYFSLGDKKKVKFTTPDFGETEQYAYIVGFNHDTLSDGTGKAGITFMMYSDMHLKMLKNANENANWANTIVRETLNSSVLDSFDDGLKNSIRTVRKDYAIYPSGSSYTNDKLWIPSTTELGRQAGETDPNGTKYTYITLSVIQKISPADFWSRTALDEATQTAPYVNDHFGKIYISSDGLAFADGYERENSVVLGFCL